MPYSDTVSLSKEALVLQYKTVKNKEEYYIFNLSAKKASVTYSYSEACRLIESYPVKRRNCQITKGNSGDRIGLKSGKGKLPMRPIPDLVKQSNSTQRQYIVL